MLTRLDGPLLLAHCTLDGLSRFLLRVLRNGFDVFGALDGFTSRHIVFYAIWWSNFRVLVGARSRRVVLLRGLALGYSVVLGLLGFILFPKREVVLFRNFVGIRG